MWTVSDGIRISISFILSAEWGSLPGVRLGGLSPRLAFQNVSLSALVDLASADAELRSLFEEAILNA